MYQRLDRDEVIKKCLRCLVTAMRPRNDLDALSRFLVRKRTAGTPPFARSMLSELTLLASLCGAAFAALGLGAQPREHFCHCSFNVSWSRSEYDALERIVLQQFATKVVACPACASVATCDAGPGALRVLVEIFLGLLLLLIGFGLGVLWGPRRRRPTVVEPRSALRHQPRWGDGATLRLLTLECDGAPREHKPFHA